MRIALFSDLQPASYVIKMAKNTIINYYRFQKKTALAFQDDLINED